MSRAIPEKLRILELIALFTALFFISVALQGGEVFRTQIAEPSLSCNAYPADTDVRFKCTIVSSTTEDILILRSPFVLEGPRSDQPEPRRHTNGDRYENVVEFDRGTVAFNEGDIMFDPFVVPTPAEISSMLRVGKGSHAVFSVEWSPDEVAFASSIWWTVKFKLVYTTESWLSWLQNRPYFEDSCPGVDLERMAQDAKLWVDASRFELQTYQIRAGHLSESCETSLSLVFNHVYSNHISFAWDN